MARTIMRSAKMERSIRFRCHETDVANIKLKAQSAGMDVSTYLRQMLIKAGVLNAL